VRERGGGEGEGREGGREGEEHRQESKEGRIGERSTRKEDPPLRMFDPYQCEWVGVGVKCGCGCVRASSLSPLALSPSLTVLFSFTSLLRLLSLLTEER
jgi:hypothetical protein